MNWIFRDAPTKYHIYIITESYIKIDICLHSAFPQKELLLVLYTLFSTHFPSICTCIEYLYPFIAPKARDTDRDKTCETHVLPSAYKMDNEEIGVNCINNYKHKKTSESRRL